MICKGCGKSFERVYNNQKYCSKECRVEHTDIEAVRAYHREYKKTPKAQAYRKAHLDKNREYNEKYRRKLGQKPVVKMSDDQLKANRARYMREWHKTEAGQLAAKARRIARRAREKFAGGKVTAKQLKQLRIDQNNKCAYCGCELDKYHIDHVVPISKGGTSDISNLALACPSCNLRKGAKDAKNF